MRILTHSKQASDIEIERHPYDTILSARRAHIFVEGPQCLFLCKPNREGGAPGRGSGRTERESERERPAFQDGTMFSGHRRSCQENRGRSKVAHQRFDRFLPAGSDGAGQLDRASPSGAGEPNMLRNSCRAPACMATVLLSELHQSAGGEHFDLHSLSLHVRRTSRMPPTH